MNAAIRSMWLFLIVALVLTGCAPASTSPPPSAVPKATQAPGTAFTPTPAKARDAVLLDWQREGGIAGFCDGVLVFADGTLRVTSCQGAFVAEKRLSAAQAEQMWSWVDAFASFDYTHRDDAAADAMTIHLAFAGDGTREAAEAEVQAMLDFVAALLPFPGLPADVTTLETSVRYVLANGDVGIYAGPGAMYPQIGQVFGGQAAWVTGVSADGAWWRVICPDDTVGNCWVSADPAWTQPTTPPGAWPVYMFLRGMSVDYPPGWFHEPGAYDETQQSAWFYPPEMDSPSVGVEMYRRPPSERAIADPFTWQPNEGGYRVHWSRPITTVQGLNGLAFVWGAYLEAQEVWDTPPTLMAILYSAEHELDIRLMTAFDEPALDLLATVGYTETIAARFGHLSRMAQSVRFHPTTGWETYHDAEAGGIFDLLHPPEWTVRASAIECATRYDLDSLQFLVFEACWAGAVGGEKLTFFETLQRFRDAFGGELAVTARDVNGVRVQVIAYSAAADNGILALDAGSGTVALWQIGERGFALIDQGNQHRQDGVYDGVLGSFMILGTTWSQPQPVEGDYAPDRHMAYNLPGLPVTILLPAGYGVMTNTEYLRRGSFVSFDFTPYGGDLPRLAEIQFFSEASIRAFHERCGGGFCFEGDYPDLERYRAQRAALDRCSELESYQSMQFGGRSYLVSNHRCTGDACVIREYTTFLGETKVDVWVMMQDVSQVERADALFATFDIVE